MTPSEDTLMAYVDGELDAQTRAQVEAAMLVNPEVAERVARHEALRSRVRGAFQETLAEPVPERLLSAARAAPPSVRSNNVVPLRRKHPRQWSWPQWGSIAASLIVGIAVGALVMRNAGVDPITSRDGRLYANAELARALTSQLASTQPATAPVQIGVSFRARAGGYCRTFALQRPDTLAGLACRDGKKWRVEVLARNETGTDAAGHYRQAASAIPKPVVQSIEDRIAGEPLDAHAEAAAQQGNWD